MAPSSARLPRQYQIIIVARTHEEQARVDYALEKLAKAGIYIHSGSERSTSTGQALEDYSPVLLDQWSNHRTV